MFSPRTPTLYSEKWLKNTFFLRMRRLFFRVGIVFVPLFNVVFWTRIDLVEWFIYLISQVLLKFWELKFSLKALGIGKKIISLYEVIRIGFVHSSFGIIIIWDNFQLVGMLSCQGIPLMIRWATELFSPYQGSVCGPQINSCPKNTVDWDVLPLNFQHIY